MATPSEQLRLKKKREYEEETYLPEYLLDSPFLPPGALEDDYSTARSLPRPDFGIRGILRWRWRRRIVPLVLIMTTAFLLIRNIHSYVVKEWFSGPRCLRNSPLMPNSTYLEDQNIDWSKLAYMTYVTNTDYLCNAVMLFEALQRFDSRPHRVILYPSSMNLAAISVDATLLQRARNDFHVTLIPVEVQKKKKKYCELPLLYLFKPQWRFPVSQLISGAASDFWFDSYTKLLAFNQTQYNRVLLLDNDATLQSHLDELFFLPPAVLAAPRAYWLPKPTLGSYMMLIQPSDTEFRRLDSSINSASQGTYDMEIINSVYGDSCAVLPHRKYSMLTGEFRRSTHPGYLLPYPKAKAKARKRPPLPETDPHFVPEVIEVPEVWDPETYFRATKYIHFSDSPFPKPWITSGLDSKSFEPPCVGPSIQSDFSAASDDPDFGRDCRARDIWLFLYSDFRERRLVSFPSTFITSQFGL